MFDLFADAPFVFKNVAQILPLIEALEDDIDGIDKVENRDFGFEWGNFAFKFELAWNASEDIGLACFQGLELASGILEFFVFDELANEFPTRIVAILFAFDFRALLNRKQFTAFDIHQRRGHDEEFAGDFEVKQAHRLDVFDKLFGETSQIDLINVDFLFLNEIEEQIQGSFEDFKFYFIFSHRHPSSLWDGTEHVMKPKVGWQC